MAMKYKCGHCGYEGYCYGAPTSSSGVSAPWCPQCQKNDKLTPIQSDSMVIGVVLEGHTLESVRKIAELKGILPSKFLSDFLQDSSMISEFLEEELEDLREGI